MVRLGHPIAYFLSFLFNRIVNLLFKDNLKEYNLSNLKFKQNIYKPHHIYHTNTHTHTISCTIT